MKLNEFKTQKQTINELGLSDIVGDTGAAALKSFGGKFTGKASGQMSATDIQARDKFVKDFVGNTASQLLNAIKAGLVTPGTPATPAPAPGQAPAPTTAPTTAPATAPAAAPTAKRVPFSQKIAPQLQNKVLRAKAGKASQPVKEDTYDQLNAIFESIIQLNEADTISDFIVNKVKNYMAGTPNLSKYEANIKQHADAIQQAYGKGGSGGDRAIMKPLETMGAMLHTITQVEQSATSDATSSAKAGVDTTAGADNMAQGAEVTPALKGQMKQLKQAISKMRKRDRDSLLAYLKQITPGTTTATPEPAPVATPKAVTKPKTVAKAKTAAPSAMGNMAAQLANIPTTSSTGGKTTGVSGVGKGVVRHSASPTNPNQPVAAKATRAASAGRKGAIARGKSKTIA